MADRTRARRGHAEPLWDRIECQRLKTAAFVMLFIGAAALSAGVLVAVAGVFLGVVLVSPDGFDDFFHVLPYLVTVAVALGALAATAHVVRMLLGPERRLPARFGARRSDTGTLVPAKSALHDMALAAGFMHAPPLWVIDDCDRVNAFVLGLSERAALIGVTRGFTERLSPDSQRAVFANLMSRLRAGDTIPATAIAAIMGPIWAGRAADLRGQQEREDGVADGVPVADAVPGNGRRSRSVIGRFIVGFLAVLLTEALMAGHERAALAASEKADAEGMLLLKDPEAMLRALEDVLTANNTVPGAGEAYSMLFYCWAGLGYAPEDDPEMERIGRLREVLGAAGHDGAVGA